MNNNKISQRVYSFAKSALAAAVLPIFLIYVLIDKPDYKIMNAMAHVVVPVAQWTGDVVSWPFRMVGKTVKNIREVSTLRTENEELHTKINELVKYAGEHDIAIQENEKLTKQLGIMSEVPQKTVFASITHNNQAFHHNTFFINKGQKDGIESGMLAMSFDGYLVGIVSDVGGKFSKVRSLYDSKSNIPVRVAGSDIYGFLQGNGALKPSIGFLSDPEFQVTKGLKLITSGIRGVLPDGIMVGELLNSTDVKVLSPLKISNIMILKFDNQDKYK